MATGRTADSRVYVGGAAWIAALPFLEWTVVGETSVTQQAITGKKAEEQSIHGAGVTVELGTLYQGGATDTVRENLDEDTVFAVLLDNNASTRMFHSVPVTLTGPTASSPADDAITDSLSMENSGHNTYGTGVDSVTAFSLSGSGTELHHRLPDLARSADTYVVCTAKTGNDRLNFYRTSGPHEFDIGHGTGPFIVKVAWPSSMANWPATITQVDIRADSGNTAAGFVITGTPAELPDG